MKLISISDVSRTMNISTRTLRYYEEIGLIESQKINDYAYRVYTEDTITRLKQILVLKNLRIPLKQIADIIKNDDSSLAITTFEENIKEIDDEIGSLYTIRTIFKKLIDKLNANSHISVNEEILSDEYLLDYVESLNSSNKLLDSDDKYRPDFNDLFVANKKLSKINDDDVRIIYLPPMTVASIHNMSPDAELTTFEIIHKFVEETNLFKIYPEARHFGFNNPDTGNKYGYERMISIPNDLDPSPLVKKYLPEGLYAAHTVPMGAFSEWPLFYKWLDESNKYEFRGGSIAGVPGWLEEPLNYRNWEKSTIYDTNNQLDLLIPIKEKQKGVKNLLNKIFNNNFKFVWLDIVPEKYNKLTDIEKYKTFVNWSVKARNKNPLVFNEVINWLLDDAKWENRLDKNEKIIMQDIIANYKEQNVKLRKYLNELKPSGLVNYAIFDALDRFDKELSGLPTFNPLKDAVSVMFSDFNRMKDRNLRKQIAGSTQGTVSASYEDIGYFNYLKECDAAVQWALFMPKTVKKQQQGFSIESFEYKKLPPMRFIGYETTEKYDKEKMKVLDAMSQFNSEFNYDVMLMHHYGMDANKEYIHVFKGRFMQENTPIPDGFVGFDFVLYDDKVGLPFLSKFAFAKFSGDVQAMHKIKGYDSDAMYDVTRNIILGQNINIPYPDKYWTAEVFINGFEKESTAYMFSADF